MGCGVVNGPTSSGPSRKTNLKQIMPEKTRKLSLSEKFRNVAKLFWLFFVHLKQKYVSDPKFLSTLGPNPTRVTTLMGWESSTMLGDIKQLSKK